MRANEFRGCFYKKAASLIITKDNSHEVRWGMIPFEKYGAGAVLNLYTVVKSRMSRKISNNRELMLPV